MAIHRTLPLTLAAAFACAGVACLDLDSFLCDNEPLSSYRLDSYSGERECESYFDIAGPVTADWVHHHTFASGSNTIHALFLHTDTVCQPGDTVILYCHGKGPSLDCYWPRVRLLHDAGRDSALAVPRYPVFALDYRGFGMSTGEPSQEGLLADGRAAMTYLRTHLGNPHIVVYGYSLGSMVATNIAAESPDSLVLRLVLEAPVGSVAGLVDDGAYLAVPDQFVTDWDFSNIERIADVRQPLYWMHGTNDGTVGMESHGQQIWNNHGAAGACNKVAGGEHRTVPQSMSSDYSAYQRALRLFIRGQCTQNSSLYTEVKP